jgi:hypothetical protein
MWKQIGEFARKLFSLSQRVQKLEESDKELRDKLKDLNERFTRQTEAMYHLAYELQRERENNDAQRRILLLEIENRFLRSERQLPAAPSDDKE